MQHQRFALANYQCADVPGDCGVYTMKRNHTVWKYCFIVALMLTVLLVSQSRNVSAADSEILGTEKEEPGTGCIMVGVYGSYLEGQQDALDRVNAIRLEACKEGIPDPRNISHALTMDDYVPIQWSTELEQIARIRAVETRFIVAHSRNNGSSIWFRYNGVSSGGEILAWNFDDTLVPGVDQFYEEKEDWLNQCSGQAHGETGHYTALIDPNNRYIGLGGFTSAGLYGATTAGELSGSNPTGHSSMLSVPTNVIQKMELSKDYVTGYSLEGPAGLYVGDVVAVTPMVQFTRGNSFSAICLDITQYTSSDTSVAVVDAKGRVTALKVGSVTITAYEGSTVRGTLSMTIVLGKRDISAAEVSLSRSSFQYDGTAKKPVVTVTHEGAVLTEGVHYTLTYSNNTDLGTATVTITGINNCTGSQQVHYSIICDHNCTFTKVDGKAEMTGYCTRCHRQVTEALPTALSFYWGTANIGMFDSSLPKGLQPGMNLYCWVNSLNGYKDFRQVVLESSDESVVKAPGVVSGDGIYPLQIVGDGVAEITVYAKMNPSCKYTFVVCAGVVDVSKLAPPTISSKTYTGSPLEPAFYFYAGDLLLTKGTDYTVTYMDNVNAGTGKAVITGIGNYKGTLTVPFTIFPNTSLSGTYSLAGCDATLSDRICLTYYVTVDKSRYSSVQDAEPFFEYTVNGNTKRVYLKDAGQKTINGRNTYAIPCYINAKEVNSGIHLEFFINRNYRDRLTDEHTLKEYLSYIVSSSAYDRTAVEMAAATLNYAAYAQKYFNYDVSQPANAGLGRALPGKSGVLDALKNVEPGAQEGYSDRVTYVGCSLILHDNTGMRLYYQAKDNFLSSDSRFQKDEKTGYWFISMEPCSITELGKSHSVTVDGITVSVSPLAYIRSALLTGTDGPLSELVLAMYDYYNAACAYQAR